MAKKKLPPSKPRNPYVALMQFKRAGSHEKPYKALRKQQKQELKTDKGEPFNKQCNSTALFIKRLAFNAPIAQLVEQ